MKRPTEAIQRAWDSPFWQALRLLIDQRNFTTIDERDVLPRLRATRVPSAEGLATWLERQEPALITDLAAYTHTRMRLANEALDNLLRTESEALDDFASISAEAVQWAKNAATSQSSKVLVQTVAALTVQASQGMPFTPDLDPQKRAAYLDGDSIWVSPRRLDGALPTLLNPVGLWEIKEYWGNRGGSKMSDAIYEVQLVGTELAVQEKARSWHIDHYLILDGKAQWAARKSDLRRAIDLLYSGLVDELFIGRELLTEWQPAVVAMWQRHMARESGR